MFTARYFPFWIPYLEVPMKKTSPAPFPQGLFAQSETSPREDFSSRTETPPLINFFSFNSCHATPVFNSSHCWQWFPSHNSHKLTGYTSLYLFLIYFSSTCQCKAAPELISASKCHLQGLWKLNFPPLPGSRGIWNAARSHLTLGHGKISSSGQ